MLNFKTTAEISVSKKIAEQIIGQDQGSQLIKKASQHRRHVLLIGHPGTGKCVGKETVIPTNQGQFTAEGLYEELSKTGTAIKRDEGIYISPSKNFCLYSINKNGKLTKARIINIYKSNSKKKCLKIKSRSGAEIIVSGEHPVLTIERGDLVFKNASEIKENEIIGLARKLPENNQTKLSIALDKNIIRSKNKISYKGKNGVVSLPIKIPQTLNEDISYFLGMYVAEGDYSNGLKFSNKNKDIQNKIKKIAIEQFNFPKENICQEKDGIKFRKSRTLTYVMEKIFDQKIWDYEKRKILAKQAHQKRAPKVILNSNKEIIWAFLSGYIDGDGHFDKEGLEIISVNSHLTKDIRLALLKVGILSRTKTKLKTATNTKLKRKKEYHGLTVTGNENLKKLYKNLSLLVDYKEKKLEDLSSKKGNTNVDLIYGINNVLEETKNILKIDYGGYGIASAAYYRYINKQQVPSRDYIKKFTLNIGKEIQKLESKRRFLEKYEDYVDKLNQGISGFYENIQKHPEIVSKRTFLRYHKRESAPTLNTICSLYELPNNTIQIYDLLKDITDSVTLNLPVKITHENTLPRKTKKLIEAYDLITLNLNDKIEKLQALHKKLNLLANSDVFFDRIKKIELIDEEVYDFEVEGAHNFITGEGIIVHNSLLGQALAEMLPTKNELQDVLCYPNEKDPNNPIVKTFPAEEGEKTIVKLRNSFENSLSSRRFYLVIVGSIFLFFIGYFLWGAFKESPYGPIAIVQGVSTVIWILFIGFILFSRAPGFLKTLTGLAMIPKPLITHKKTDPAPFLDACLLPGQKVFTNPHPTEIEKTKGKMVYNAEGKPQKVTNVEIIKWKGKIYNIKPRLLFPFTATPNHPFLVLERPKSKQFKLREFKSVSKNLKTYIKWKKAKELNEGDMLIYPEIKHPQEYKIIYLNNKKTRNAVKEKIVLDEEAAEILGWFLAEGYTRNQEKYRRGDVGFTLGIHEHKEVERLAELIRDKFGAKVKFDFHNSSSIGLIVHSKTLSEWFENEFGKGAKNKRIPKIIFESPKNVKLKFLQAYIKGDGFDGKEVVAVATTSKNLSEDLVFLFSSLGIFPTCSFRKMKDSKIKGRIVKGPEIYELQIGGKQQYKIGKERGDFQHYFSKDNLHFIPIRKIWTHDYNGDIINMETEDGTYLMPCITHNTGSHSGALLGDVLHDPLQSGGLGTPPHERIVPGMIHRANGGVLFIDEVATLSPKSQQELLTVLQEKKYPITGQSEHSSGAMTRTQPVPADFVLVAAGNEETVEKMHPALRSRIRGYGYEIHLNHNIDDTQENQFKIAQFVAQEVVKDGKIPHFSRAAVEEIINEAKRRSGTSGKLTLHLRELGGLVRAAGDLAKEEEKEITERDHVIRAKTLARPLEQQLADKYIEEKKKYEIIITKGKIIGRVNGLAVMGAETSLSGIVLPIESEITPGGSQGTEIVATGQLGKIAQEAVKNVSAIILKYFGKDLKEKYDIFVQFLYTYSGVEGDSASIAVATAIVSAFTKAPVKQNYAMTGSLSVRGEVLAVGGVTQKAEAAIGAGLSHLIIPKANLADVILSEENRKKIKLIPVERIEDVLKEVLDWKGKENILRKLK